MNRNSFSGIRALNVIVFILFAKLVWGGSFAAGFLLDSLIGIGVIPVLLIGLAGTYYGVRQAWFTAFGDQKFGQRA